MPIPWWLFAWVHLLVSGATLCCVFESLRRSAVNRRMFELFRGHWAKQLEMQSGVTQQAAIEALGQMAERLTIIEAKLRTLDSKLGQPIT